MNKYKKIASSILLSTLVIGNLNISYVNADMTSNPTNEEKTKVESEILKLQSNLFNNSKTYLEKFTSDFQKLTNYEETGKSSFELKLDEDMFGKANANISLDNYKIKNATLDSDISGNVSVKGNYTPVYGSGFEIDLSTFASMISKDGEVYALLRDLNFKITDENISKILEELKKQFSDNKYIKFPSDEASKQALNLIKSFNLSSILTETQDILKKPLLTTYKKSGDKYLLVPTKFACDSYFELDKKLNFSNAWYTPETCSESTYKSFVKEFIKSGDLYLTLGGENTLGFYSNQDNTIVDFILNYNEKSISKIDLIVTPDQNKFKDEGFNFHFKSGEYLKLIFSIDNKKTFINFDSELDNNNNFVEINSNIKSSEVNGSLALKNKNISGFYMIKEKGYDYSSQNWDYKLKNIYGVKISGNFNNENKLEKLNLKFAGIDIKNKKVFVSGKTSFESGNYAFSISSNDEYSTFKIDGTGLIDAKYFKLDSKFTMLSKAYQYYADTQNRDKQYSGEFNMLVDQKDDKNNGEIYLNLNSGEKNIFKMSFKNDAKREYKSDIKIEIPKDFKELDLKELESINY